MAKIRIAAAADDGYAQYLGVLIASILKTSEPGDEFSFYVVDGGITEVNRKKLLDLRRLKDFDIQWLSASFDQELADCPEVSYFSMNAYSRLLLPELMAQYDRVLYLDCDIVVNGSLAELWNTSLEGCSVGVVPDIGEIVRKNDRYRKRLNLMHTRLFNSGMLLLDLQQLRKNKRFKETILWIAQHREEVSCPDQEGLNVIFQNDKKELSYRWNFNSKWDIAKSWTPAVYNRLMQINPDFTASAANPVIIHYIGRKKPWHYAFTGGFSDLWLSMRQGTPWHANGTPQPKTFCERIKKFLKGNVLVRTLRRRNRISILLKKDVG
ncbi:MAG: glycosyltransferase family 8 protein [Planctomycetia bacterium]|nr:glycosyltransferase family 8 protein [Planctomycetia bacterium]